MYAATGGPDVKWGGTDFKWGVGHHWPPRWRRPCTCCSVFPPTCRKHCLGRLKRQNTSIFFVLIFVLAWSHAAENRSNACWRPCWEYPPMQYQFVRKKQAVHPAVLNSDTLFDVSVTVYPIHIDQGLSNFWERTTWSIPQQFEGQTSYILLNQHISRKYIIFYYWQNVFWGRVK